MNNRVRWLLLLYAVRGIEAPPHYFIAGLPAVLMLAGPGSQAMWDARFSGLKGRLRMVPGVATGVRGAGLGERWRKEHDTRAG